MPVWFNCPDSKVRLPAFDCVWHVHDFDRLRKTRDLTQKAASSIGFGKCFWEGTAFSRAARQLAEEALAADGNQVKPRRQPANGSIHFV
jgi:hypothetical protein